MFKVGNKVEILRQDIFHLKHRKNRNGIIVAIDGSYIDVRPMWCKWIIELYPNEIMRIG
jgi:hypothetical protein